MEFDNINALDEILTSKHICKRKHGYEINISVNGKDKYLGVFTELIDAKQVLIDYLKNQILTDLEKNNLDLNEAKIYEKKYLIFKEGFVYSLPLKKFVGHKDHLGYMEVMINGKSVRIHRIIASAFIPNYNNYPCINHKDGDKTNNNISNLEWCTHSQNTQHAYDTGLEKKIIGENHHAHKITEEIARYIKIHYIPRDKKYGGQAMADYFGISRSIVSSIVANKSWRWI